MTARYHGILVKVVRYAAKGDRSQIAIGGMLRWVRTADLADVTRIAT